MEPRSVIVYLPAARDAVFAFFSDLEQVPRWTGGFHADPRREDGCWRSRTPFGPCWIAIVADPRTGVVDFLHGEKRDEMSVLPLRVIPRPHGCAVIATLLPAPGAADDCVDFEFRRIASGLRGLTAHFGGGEIAAPEERARSLSPGLVTARFHESWDFYTTHLGFRTEQESNCHVELAHPGGARLTLLRQEIDGMPPQLTHPSDGRGFWLHLPVSDVDADHARLVNQGVEILEEPQDRPWRERDCRLRDPNGVLILLSHELAGPQAMEPRPAAS